MINHDFVDGFAMTLNFEAEFSALVTVLGVLIITPKNVSTHGPLLFLGKSPMRVESFENICLNNIIEYTWIY